MAQMTGAEILWESLVREGVTDVFGYPGGAILPAYDAMLKFPIRHVLFLHEQECLGVHQWSIRQGRGSTSTPRAHTVPAEGRTATVGRSSMPERRLPWIPKRPGITTPRRRWSP